MSGMHEGLARTWTLISTVPAELPMGAPGSAEPWLTQPMDAPGDGWDRATGVILTITPDGRFTEQVDGPAAGGPIDWWELDGTLRDAPAPSHGLVVAEGGQWHLVPDEGIDRVTYGVRGLRHGEDTAEVADRILLEPDGTLLRLIVVDQGDGGQGRSWYRYRDADAPGAEEEPAPSAAAIAHLVREHSAPSQPPQEPEDFLLEPLRAAVRVELSDETAARILADHRTAVDVDDATRRLVRETSGHPPAEPETEGLVDLHAIGVRAVDGVAVVDSSIGYVLRLCDGAGVRDHVGRRPPGAGPGGARLGLEVLTQQVAPLVRAAGAPGPHGVVEAASLLVSDLRRERLRWVIVEGAAGYEWREHSHHMTMARQLVPVARALRSMTEQQFAQLPALGGVS